MPPQNNGLQAGRGVGNQYSALNVVPMKRLAANSSIAATLDLRERAAAFAAPNEYHALSSGRQASERYKVYEGRKMASQDELVDAKIAAAEARTDTKIVRLEGKMDLVIESLRSSRAEARDNRRAVIGNLWVIFGSIVAILAILVTVAPVIFDMGFRLRETVTKEVQDRIPAPAAPASPNSQR
jgi:hypothetical protein